MEPDLRTLINALSCIGHGTRCHFFWKQPQVVSLLFQDFGLDQRFFLCVFFLFCQADKEVQLSIFEGPKKPGEHTSEEYFPDVLRFSFAHWPLGHLLPHSCCIL